jgi:hypothetical protein
MLELTRRRTSLRPPHGRDAQSLQPAAGEEERRWKVIGRRSVFLIGFGGEYGWRLVLGLVRKQEVNGREMRRYQGLGTGLGLGTACLSMISRSRRAEEEDSDQSLLIHGQ